MLLKISATVALAGCLALTPAVTATLTEQGASQTKAPQTDNTLKDRIEFRLETSELVRKYDVKVKVASGVVTLSGGVATAAQKAEAGRLANVPGVTKVENTITINPNEDKSVADRVKAGLNKAGEKITDAWITTKVKWFFVGEDALKGSDINVDTMNRVVTLKGTVASAAGRARANELAKNTDGVTKVVDQLAVK